MTKYICYNCGNEFEELISWEESRGEFWGVPCYETCYGCPACHSDDVEEVKDDEQTGFS